MRSRVESKRDFLVSLGFSGPARGFRGESLAPKSEALNSVPRINSQELSSSDLHVCIRARACALIRRQETLRKWRVSSERSASAAPQPARPSSGIHRCLSGVRRRHPRLALRRAASPPGCPPVPVLSITVPAALRILAWLCSQSEEVVLCSASTHTPKLSGLSHPPHPE